MWTQRYSPFRAAGNTPEGSRLPRPGFGGEGEVVQLVLWVPGAADHHLGQLLRGSGLSGPGGAGASQAGPPGAAGPPEGRSGPRALLRALLRLCPPLSRPAMNCPCPVKQSHQEGGSSSRAHCEEMDLKSCLAEEPPHPRGLGCHCLFPTELSWPPQRQLGVGVCAT